MDSASVIQILRDFVVSRRKKDPPPLSPEMSLYREGLGLDSLDLVDLAGLLEQQLGSEPFSAGDLPKTVGDILRFYGVSPSA